MKYKEAWQFLDDLQFFKIKLGLDSMRSFLASLDDPQEKLKFVHIAGTNGKGSTAALLFSMLTEAGFKVGLYTSPHLSSVRERFRIGASYISEADFAENAEKIVKILDGRQITYFEFTTTLALLWFAAEEVDLAIMEVGMGGRLDATNVINPCLSVITNVSMDHEAYLGNTLSEVAMEKAGIIKEGVPVVTAAGPDESRTVIEKKALEQRAPLYLLGRDFTLKDNDSQTWSYSGIGDKSRHDSLVCGLPGPHQIENAALALASLDLLDQYGFHLSSDAVRNGLKKARWPGRLEYIAVNRKNGRAINGESDSESERTGTGPEFVQFLLDGAHNPAGIKTLKKVLQESSGYRKLIGVWASMADKDIRNSLLPIVPLFDHIILTRPESERSARPSDMKKLLPENIQRKAVCADSVNGALLLALEMAEPGDLVCVAGSLYLIGEARFILLGEVAL